VLSESEADRWSRGTSGPGGLFRWANFPRLLWSEWNGNVIATCVRRFWKGHGGTVGELASRFGGQQRSLCAQMAAARARASISSPRTTGFTCATLSGYDANHQRGERARRHRRRCKRQITMGWSCGTEGPTDDSAINALRAAAAAKSPRHVWLLFARRADAAGGR